MESCSSISGLISDTLSPHADEARIYWIILGVFLAGPDQRRPDQSGTGSNGGQKRARQRSAFSRSGRFPSRASRLGHQTACGSTARCPRAVGCGPGDALFGLGWAGYVHGEALQIELAAFPNRPAEMALSSDLSNSERLCCVSLARKISTMGIGRAGITAALAVAGQLSAALTGFGNHVGV